jgi:cold shock protein
MPAAGRAALSGCAAEVQRREGYGFISPDEGGEDLFVHYSGIVGSGFRTLEEGTRVTYEATQGRKGMQAENVSRV